MPIPIARWPHEIHLVGMGGIGTAALEALLKLEVPEVHLWDMDTVEAHNLPTQFLYCPADVGSPKVEAAERFVRERGFKTKVIPHVEEVTFNTALSGIVISGVDSMTSRENIWGTVSYSPLIFLYIDARMGDDEIQVHTLDPNIPEDVGNYETWLFPNEEALELGCSTRENPHSALGIAQVLSAHLTLFARGEPIRGYLSRRLLSESRPVQ